MVTTNQNIIYKICFNILSLICFPWCESTKYIHRGEEKRQCGLGLKRTKKV